jgi:hypothetical protein
LEKTLVGLTKILAILGVILVTVAAIIWVFTGILTTTGDFLVAMLSVYLLGGLAAIFITFIFSVGSRVQPAAVTKSRMRTYWAIVLIVAGIGTLGATLPNLYGILRNEGYYSDSQILIMYTLTFGVLLLALGLVLGGAYLFHSRTQNAKQMQGEQ